MSVSSEQMPWCIKVNEYTFQGTFDSIALLGRVLSSREANMKSQNCLPQVEKWQKIRRCTHLLKIKWMCAINMFSLKALSRYQWYTSSIYHCDV